jgi:hypothetical protein
MNEACNVGTRGVRGVGRDKPVAAEEGEDKIMGQEQK